MEHGTGSFDKTLNHRGKLRRKDAAGDLSVLNAELIHGLGRQIAAAPVRILNDILPEVSQLQRGADLIGQQRQRFFSVSAHP